MTAFPRQPLLAALPLLCAMLAVPASAAEAFPSKPIRLVVPFTPGGTTDILARLVAQKSGDVLGQQIVVDNRPGAGGNIGAEAVARTLQTAIRCSWGRWARRSPTSSSTRACRTTARTISPPVTLVANSPNVLLINSTLSATSVSELIALAKREPGKINYASTSTGGSPHLSGELLNAMAGINMQHVPYKGAAPAMTDLLAGQVNLMFDNLPSALAQIQAGKVKALAVTSVKRASVLPSVPTVRESGLPGYEVNSWFGLLAPAGTPPERVRQIQQAVDKVLVMPDVRKRIEQLGAEPGGEGSAAFAAEIKADTEKWSRVIKTAGIKAQ